MSIYLQETELLDYSSEKIKNLVDSKNWKSFSEKNKILGIYNYGASDYRVGNQ